MNAGGQGGGYKSEGEGENDAPDIAVLQDAQEADDEDEEEVDQLLEGPSTNMPARPRKRK